MAHIHDAADIYHMIIIINWQNSLNENCSKAIIYRTRFLKYTIVCIIITVHSITAKKVHTFQKVTVQNTLLSRRYSSNI